MKAPLFEKFTVYDSMRSTFIVDRKKTLHKFDVWVEGSTVREFRLLRVDVLLFIESAIREKLERESGRDANNELARGARSRKARDNGESPRSR